MDERRQGVVPARPLSLGCRAGRGTAPPRARPAVTDKAFWHASVAALCAELDATPEGLTGSAAVQRLSIAGPNLLRIHHEPTFLPLLLSRFRNPLVILLVAASVIAALTGDVMSVTLDAVQKNSAGKAAEQLRQPVAIRTIAVRDGQPTEVPAGDIVTG